MPIKNIVFWTIQDSPIIIFLCSAKRKQTAPDDLLSQILTRTTIRSKNSNDTVPAMNASYAL